MTVGGALLLDVMTNIGAVVDKSGGTAWRERDTPTNGADTCTDSTSHSPTHSPHPPPTYPPHTPTHPPHTPPTHPPHTPTHPPHSPPTHPPTHLPLIHPTHLLTHPTHLLLTHCTHLPLTHCTHLHSIFFVDWFLLDVSSRAIFTPFLPSILIFLPITIFPTHTNTFPFPQLA